MATITFPQTVRKEGTTLTATIYRKIRQKETKDGPAEYTEYTLAYYHDGKRKLKTSSDYQALRASADELLTDLSQGRTDPQTLTIVQRNEYKRALKTLRPTRQSLDVAVNHYAKAFEILKGDLIVAAAQEYVKRNLHKVQPRLVSEAVKDFIEEKRKQGRSDAHVDRLESHLQKFAGSMVQDVGSVTASDIEMFLDSLQSGKEGVGARTRDNYADSIVTLYRWAKRKRYVPSDFDEMERIQRLDKGEDGPIEIYSPVEMRALLAAADAQLIPFLAIGAFAGLRSSEIMRLDWADVRTENGEPHIVVQKGKNKKRGKSRRIVPISENLRAWLTPHVKQNGAVWPHCVAYLYELIREIVPRAQALLRETDCKATLEWKNNALRHSFISYRVATVKKVDQVALEAGNSPQMIFSNYRELVTDQEAAAWFAIMPDKAKAKKQP